MAICYFIMDSILLIQFIYFSVKARLKERKLKQMAATVTTDYSPVPRPSHVSQHHRLIYHDSV